MIHRRLLSTAIAISANLATVRSARIVILVELVVLFLTHSLFLQLDLFSLNQYTAVALKQIIFALVLVLEHHRSGSINK